MRRAIACIILSILILGCTTSYQSPPQQPGSQPPATPAPPANNTLNQTPQQPPEVTVEIRGYSFSPQVVEVAIGTEVTWVNNDAVSHTVTSDSGEFNTGAFGTGQNRSYTFTKAGTYTYHCSIHPGMKGTVTVR